MQCDALAYKQNRHGTIYKADANCESLQPAFELTCIRLSLNLQRLWIMFMRAEHTGKARVTRLIRQSEPKFSRVPMKQLRRTVWGTAETFGSESQDRLRPGETHAKLELRHLRRLVFSRGQPELVLR